MYLSIRTFKERHVIVVALEGNITLGEASGDLRDAIKDLLAAGEKNIVLDLAEVSYIDSAGLGELIGAWVSCARAGAALRLLHLQRRVKGLMQVTRLLTVFECFEDREEAIHSFEPATASLQA
jgi:anti-sigma B factor antagonist